MKAHYVSISLSVFLQSTELISWSLEFPAQLNKVRLQEIQVAGSNKSTHTLDLRRRIGDRGT